MKDYINLMPGESERKSLLSKEGGVALGIIIILTVLGILYGFKFYEVQRLKDEKAQLVIKKDRINNELNAMLSEINNLNSKRKGVPDNSHGLIDIRGLTKGRIIWSPILREISFLVSSEAGLTLIESRKKKDTEIKELHFVGSAVSHGDITNFIAALERADSFTNINLSFAQQGEIEKKTIVNFDITADLKKPL